jgi:hypothetical protein
MTPKEKAFELQVKFSKLFFAANSDYWTEPAKGAALMAVDEIIESGPVHPHDGSYCETLQDRVDEVVEYWQDVKEEIRNL